MAKKAVMVSIDEYIHKQAKEKDINISSVCESAIRMHTNPTKKDVPDNGLKLVCTECGKLIEFGFLCEETNKFRCEDCEKNKCVMTNHLHIRIPGFNGENIEKLK